MICNIQEKIVTHCLICIMILVVFFSNTICAQTDFNCGTVVTKAFLDKEKNQPSTQSITNNITKCLNKTVSVFVHIVLDSSGKSNILLSDLTNSVTNLNQLYAPICLSFKVCKIDSIPAWKYDQYSQTTEEAEIILDKYKNN